MDLKTKIKIHSIFCKAYFLKSIFDPLCSHVERNDSGVGSDSGVSNSKLSCPEASGNLSVCRDCDTVLADEADTLCCKCNKRRVERREIIR